MLFKLNNVIQPFAWGSKTMLSQWAGISNPDNQPQAELWMGVHPSGESRVAQTNERLSEVIARDIPGALGDYTARAFGQLPFLFKVLAVDQPLSIQVHPDLASARAGYQQESAMGLAQDAPERHFHDPNHKPELVYALTPFSALNGFRTWEEIQLLLADFNLPFVSSLALAEHNEGSNRLENLFKAVMALDSEQKQQVFLALDAFLAKSGGSHLVEQAREFIKPLRQLHPDDIGVLAPLFLNIVFLEPGEAMFLYPRTLHAYVSGLALEVMANSDNVLRAGLTPKYVDVSQVVAHTDFHSSPAESLKLVAQEQDGVRLFPVPVEDFRFAVIAPAQDWRTRFLRGPEILLCLEGEVTIRHQNTHISLSAGESLFVGNKTLTYDYQGNGTLARAYN